MIMAGLRGLILLVVVAVEANYEYNRGPPEVTSRPGPRGPCDKPCPDGLDPMVSVCASDGQTYNNFCRFENAKCRNPELEFKRNGPCRVHLEDPLRPRCDYRCPGNKIPVCASDGQTYDNYCYFEQAECRNPQLEFSHDGPCTGRPSGGGRPTPPPRMGGYMTGPLRPRCDYRCPGNKIPVCASDGQTYDNYCYFEQAECRNPQLEFRHDGPCTGRPSGGGRPTPPPRKGLKSVRGRPSGGGRPTPPPRIGGYMTGGPPTPPGKPCATSCSRCKLWMIVVGAC